MAHQEESKENSGEYTRRDFLVWVITALGGLIAAGLGGVGFLSFVSPAWKKQKEAWINLGPLGNLPDGTPVQMDYVQRRADGWLVEEGRSSVWLLKQDGAVTAFDPHCTHLGCPYHWDANKAAFLCPCHGGVFSKDGKVLDGPPPRPLDRYAVKIEQGDVFIFPSAIRSGRQA